ncbi:MAG: MFS transporter [Azonexus sp.]|jgi:MFS family permease|nr:MFS transporter [Azonexus sp.]
MRLPSALTPLQHRPFLLLTSGSFLTFLGAQIQIVGASWEMMSLTTSSTLVALVQSASTLPALLFALLGGALADMFDRRRVLMTAQGIMLIAACLLLVAQQTGAMTPWLLLGLTFLLNIGSTLRMPVQAAMTNELVGVSEITRAVSITGISFNLARSVGPGLAGIVIAPWGVMGAFVVNTICICGAIGSSFSLSTTHSASGKQPSHIGRAILEGLRYCAAEAVLRNMLVRTFCWVFFAISVWALLPLIAKQNLGGGPLLLGILFACQGIGAITGATVTPSLLKHFGIKRLEKRLTLAFAPVLAISACADTLWWLVPALLIGGCVWLTFLNVPSTTMQLAAPPLVRGRVLSINLMALYASMGLGAWFWGMVADLAGLRVALLVAAAGLTANLLLHRWLPHEESTSQIQT